MPKITSKPDTAGQAGEEQLTTPPAGQANNEINQPEGQPTTPPADQVNSDSSQQDGAIEAQQQPAPDDSGNAAGADSQATVVADGGDAAEADAPTTVGPNAIEVVAKVESFRRAGFSFSRTPTVIRLSELDEQQFKQLYGEPMLAVKITYVREG